MDPNAKGHQLTQKQVDEFADEGLFAFTGKVEENQVLVTPPGYFAMCHTGDVHVSGLRKNFLSAHSSTKCKIQCIAEVLQELGSESLGPIALVSKCVDGN